MKHRKLIGKLVCVTWWDAVGDWSEMTHDDIQALKANKALATMKTYGRLARWDRKLLVVSGEEVHHNDDVTYRNNVSIPAGWIQSVKSL